MSRTPNVLINIRSLLSRDPKVYVPSAGAHRESMGTWGIYVTGQGHGAEREPPPPLSQTHRDTWSLTLWGTLDRRPRVLTGFHEQKGCRCHWGLFCPQSLGGCQGHLGRSGQFGPGGWVPEVRPCHVLTPVAYLAQPNLSGLFVKK